VRALAFVCLIAALMATAFAWLGGYVGLCQSDTDACADPTLHTLVRLQLACAVAAVTVAAAMGVAAGRGRRAVAWAAFAAVLLLLAAWGVLLDLAVHDGEFTLEAEAVVTGGPAVTVLITYLLIRRWTSAEGSPTRG
jgi:hypothetical protein